VFVSINSPLPRRIVVASHNAGKIREISALLMPFGINVVSAGALGLFDPEETELSFAGNAKLKAEFVTRASGEAALSDDSGLVVPALGGAPGIYSARWAGETRDFSYAMERVRTALGSAAALRPVAHFTCALALSRPDTETAVFEGHVHGHLEFPPRGMHGFGYDPIFVAQGETQTFGEMDPARKHAISHRAAAFARFTQSLAL
jgi:XTP/dITP diphosphohydrolase